MPGKSVGGAAGRLWNAARSTDWKAKAKVAGEALKAEYEAGKRGEDGPSPQLWGSPKEQLDRLIDIMRAGRPLPDEDRVADAAADSGSRGHTGTAEEEPDHQTDDRPDDPTDAAEVAEALRGVDWAKVKDSLSDRGGQAARTVRTMAEQVDWERVQPVAAQVSSALISAVAAGQLPIGGPVSRKVARTVLNQGGLAHKVAEQLRAGQPGQAAQTLPDMRPVIDVEVVELRELGAGETIDRAP